MSETDTGQCLLGTGGCTLDFRGIFWETPGGFLQNTEEFQSQSTNCPNETNLPLPGDSSCDLFIPCSWRSLNLRNAHITVSEGSQRIAIGHCLVSNCWKSNKKINHPPLVSKCTCNMFYKLVLNILNHSKLNPIHYFSTCFFVDMASPTG